VQQRNVGPKANLCSDGGHDAQRRYETLQFQGSQHRAHRPNRFDLAGDVLEAGELQRDAEAGELSDFLDEAQTQFHLVTAGQRGDAERP
jgi:hypothetical protein